MRTTLAKERGAVDPARSSGIGAASNIATVYRDAGKLQAAQKWALRAAEMGDGDAAVTAAYGYLYGVGVRPNARIARRLFRCALLKNTTQYGREEALYHLAVSEADGGNRRGAIPLLKRANRDGDYPEAASLLSQITTRAELRPCRSRRQLRKDLQGHAACPLHPIDGRD